MTSDIEATLRAVVEPLAAPTRRHYHLSTDLPEHVQYDTVARAVRIAEALAHELAAA